MPIKILRKDEIYLDGVLTLSLELILDTQGKGYVRYEHYHSRKESTSPGIDSLTKLWFCKVSPSRWNFFTHTVPEAVRKGNLFYDRMLFKYTGQNINLPSLEEMMNEIQTVCNDYKKG